MLFKTCDFCGANLDPGERCDCNGAQGKKKDGPPKTTKTGPSETQEDKKSSDDIIPHKAEKIKSFSLKDFRCDNNLSIKSVVKAVRVIYPKYDKSLQVKCEHGEEYGIELRADAVEALLEKFTPEELEKERKRKNGGHRLTCRISCRLEDGEFAKLIQNIKADGFITMQDFLTSIIREYNRNREVTENV